MCFGQCHAIRMFFGRRPRKRCTLSELLESWVDRPIGWFLVSPVFLSFVKIFVSWSLSRACSRELLESVNVSKPSNFFYFFLLLFTLLLVLFFVLLRPRFIKDFKI